jgi:nicotinamide-nucleotide amidase
MAAGARIRFGADISVGITGVAGPGGGTAEKPVGLVHLLASGPGTSVARKVLLPGSRSDVRNRAVVVAMHMVRDLLAQLSDRTPGWPPTTPPRSP